MGEREQNRATVEHMAAAIKQHEAQRGHHLTSGEAQSRAAEAARSTDRKASEGALRNKRRRAPKPAPDVGRARGRIFVDYGKKG